MVATTKNEGTSRDKHNKSFVDSPQRGEPWSAQEVFVGNTGADPIPVEFETKGEVFSNYNEINSAGGSTTTIIEKTIAVAKGANLRRVFVSGDNKAYFFIEINGQVKFKGRTWFTDFNLSVDLNNESLNAGDIIKIIVENKSVTVSDFNATLIYSEFDV